ncbi:MAG TPA: thermonuclease family protein [Verrucomicrobiae bacterium]|nr:thermonuclease family protein [Verrucomicrobiae bacterium]
MRVGKRTQRRLFKLLIALVILGLGYVANSRQIQVQPPPQIASTVSPGYYRVVSFSDGDTIVVDMDGTSEHIRMIGVDTPETKDPRKPVQCFGQAASDFTKQLIGIQPVRLESDPLSTNRDRYNRLLRYVYLPDGRLVEAEIIRQGYGFAYTSFPFTKADEFTTYQREAREQNRGLWTSCPQT